MNTQRLIIFPLFAMILSCSQKMDSSSQTDFSEAKLRQQIRALNTRMTQATQEEDIQTLMSVYTDKALLLAEYQPLIDGKTGIRGYYSEMFRRQDIRSYTKETQEIFDFGETILEIGIFQKELPKQETQRGEYWNIWTRTFDETLHLSAETFGFFHHLENPASQLVDSLTENVWNLGARKGRQIPLEFDAYAALMENIVRDRDTPKALELYTEDGSYTPFADTTKHGTANLSKHYYAYHENPVVIDSIEGSTYDFILVPDGVIRYTQFYVEWTVPDYSGKNEGTGISYWRRQPDNSLKIHRQIAHHTYFN